MALQRQQSTAPPGHIPWSGDPASMSHALRNLLVTGETDRLAISLAMLWVRGMVDTMRVLKQDPAAWAAVKAIPRIQQDRRLASAVEVAEGRAPSWSGVPQDQAVEFQAMHDAANWPTIIGPRVGASGLPSSDAPRTDLRDDPRYVDALYDAIRRNRLLTGNYLLRTVKARPADRVPGGYIYVGPSHSGDKPSGLDSPSARRKAVNEAIWHELGVGEGSQASINTWDLAKFSFGPGFAAPGLLRKVMDNLRAEGPEVVQELRRAGVSYESNTWYVVDPATRSVKSGNAALDLLSQDRGLIGAFLDTAADPAMRRQWMEAEWKAMQGPSGAAAIPDRVITAWPDIPVIVFVAHCVHWGGLTWKQWDSATQPSLFEVVRRQAPHVASREDRRILAHLSAQTFFSFSGGLLMKELRARGRRQGIEVNLPDDWATGHSGAVALPTKVSTPVFQIIEADEN